MPRVFSCRSGSAWLLRCPDKDGFLSRSQAPSAGSRCNAGSPRCCCAAIASPPGPHYSRWPCRSRWRRTSENCSGFSFSYTGSMIVWMEHTRQIISQWSRTLQHRRLSSQEKIPKYFRTLCWFTSYFMKWEQNNRNTFVNCWKSVWVLLNLLGKILFRVPVLW